MAKYNLSKEFNTYPNRNMHKMNCCQPATYAEINNDIISKGSTVKKLIFYVQC